MSRDGCVALSCGAMGLSAVCDCGISLSYSLTIFARHILGLRHYDILGAVARVLVIYIACSSYL